jgi:3-dehydroquinate dehydratase
VYEGVWSDRAGLYEHFAWTPAAARLLSLLQRQKSLGADIAKFAVMANSLRDALTVLEAKRRLGIPFRAISVRPHSNFSRPDALEVGAAMTYCSAERDKEGGPGQLPVAKTRHVVETLAHQTSAAGLAVRRDDSLRGVRAYAGVRLEPRRL